MNGNTERVIDDGERMKVAWDPNVRVWGGFGLLRERENKIRRCFHFSSPF